MQHLSISASDYLVARVNVFVGWLPWLRCSNKRFKNWNEWKKKKKKKDRKNQQHENEMEKVTARYGVCNVWSWCFVHNLQTVCSFPRIERDDRMQCKQWRKWKYERPLLSSIIKLVEMSRLCFLMECVSEQLFNFDYKFTTMCEQCMI